MVRYGIDIRRPFRRRTSPGAMPGRVTVDPEAPKPVVSATIVHTETIEERRIEDLATFQRNRPHHPLMWINIDGLGDADTIRKMGELFQLHPLALEDVVNVHQRPKAEEYGETLFIVARMVNYTGRVETEQISLFLGRDFVLTFQERPGDCLDPVRERIRRGSNRIRERGVGYLAYAILDAVIDGYFPVLESIGERLDQFDERITAERGRVDVSQIHAIRRQLLYLRRTLWPHRDALHQLVRDEVPLFSDETNLYLRDCYDHTMQLLEVTENFREICTDLREIHLASIGQRTNEIMKVLAIFSSVFIPLGFIAGVYGMNFDTKQSEWNMPELDWYWGYPFALGVMGLVAGSLLYFFWRRGWFST